jgi:hypothetical protein
MVAFHNWFKKSVAIPLLIYLAGATKKEAARRAAAG